MPEVRTPHPRSINARSASADVSCTCLVVDLPLVVPLHPLICRDAFLECMSVVMDEIIKPHSRQPQHQHQPQS
jgi:hypothetical protein